MTPCLQTQAGGGPALQARLDPVDELAGGKAVDDPVVERHAHVHDAADRDRFIDDARPALDGLRGEDGRLRLVDDGAAGEGAVGAGVVQREGAALHVLGLELLVARARRQVVHGARQFRESQVVRVVHDGDDQTFGVSDRDSQVDVLLEQDPVVGPARVEVWELVQRFAEDLGHEWQIGEGEAVAGPETLSLGFAVFDELADVDLDQRPGVGRGGLAAHHVLRDRAAHCRDAYKFLLTFSRGRLSGGFRGCGSRSRRSFCRRRWLRARLDEGQHVVPGYAAALAAALDRRGVDAVLLSQPAHGGAEPAFLLLRGFRGGPAAIGGRGGGRRSRSCRGLRRRLGGGARSRRRLRLDLGDLGAHVDGAALGDRDLDQRALEGRGNLGVDLVGHDLDQGLVPLDEVAFLLQPAVDGALGDGLTELRHLDGGYAHASIVVGPGTGPRVRGAGWRRRRESNSGWRFCRPLPYHLATSPAAKARF